MCLRKEKHKIQTVVITLYIINADKQHTQN